MTVNEIQGTDGVWYREERGVVTTYKTVDGSREGRAVFENHQSIEQFQSMSDAIIKRYHYENEKKTFAYKTSSAMEKISDDLKGAFK